MSWLALPFRRLSSRFVDPAGLGDGLCGPPPSRGLTGMSDDSAGLGCEFGELRTSHCLSAMSDDLAGPGDEFGEPRPSHCLSAMSDDLAGPGDEFGEPRPSHCLSGKPDADSDQGSVQLSLSESQLAPGILPFKEISQAGSSPGRRLFFQVKSSAISHFLKTPPFGLEG